MIYFFLILLILHLVCCFLTVMGIHTGFFNIHRYMFFVVLFLPVWGFLIVLVLHYQVFLKGDNKKEISMEKMRLESEIYKAVTIEANNNVHSVIPLEEALVINSAGERRSLIMDVLNDNPREYIEFLQKAGDNDDTEVVHYAVTAMVEISKENDFMLQKFEREYSARPDDYEVLSGYCDFLWDCLDQNLMQGQVEVMNRIHFNELIGKKLEICETVSDYDRLIKNCFKLKEFNQAWQAIEKMDKLCPDSEDVIMHKLDYFSRTDSGSEIKNLLEYIASNNIYLSAGAKEVIAFWKV